MKTCESIPRITECPKCVNQQRRRRMTLTLLQDQKLHFLRCIGDSHVLPCWNKQGYHNLISFRQELHSKLWKCSQVWEGGLENVSLTVQIYRKEHSYYHESERSNSDEENILHQSTFSHHQWWRLDIDGLPNSPYSAWAENNYRVVKAITQDLRTSPMKPISLQLPLQKTFDFQYKRTWLWYLG